MLHTIEDMLGYSIHAAVDDVGKTVDYYFDDKQWVIRYLVLETGSWLSSRKVLLSPFAIKDISRENKTFSVSMNSEQVKNSPLIDLDKPVSLQDETEYTNYYGYPRYWDGDFLWGASMYPMTSSDTALTPVHTTKPINYSATQHHHLRSCEAIIGNHVEALDGPIGHIEQMLMDEQTWAIRYLIINTSNWGLGHQVLIAPQWIKAIHWEDKKVFVDKLRQNIKAAPRFDPAEGVTQKFEKDLFLHYGHRGYWE